VQSADVWLEAGQRLPLSLRLAVKMGPTKLRLLWESDSMEKVAIPSDSLYHTLGSSTTPLALTVTPTDTDPLASTLNNP
jgi:hypothetical protein